MNHDPDYIPYDPYIPHTPYEISEYNEAERKRKAEERIFQSKLDKCKFQKRHIKPKGHSLGENIFKPPREYDIMEWIDMNNNVIYTEKYEEGKYKREINKRRGNPKGIVGELFLN